MKKMYFIWLQLAVGVSVLLFSCEKVVNVVDPSVSSATQATGGNGMAESEMAKAELGKALAKALQEKEVRAFIKDEALQMFDGDYDVLYALVKDKKLTTGITFEQTLAKYTSSSGDYMNWSERAPLVTIFVPKLVGFTPQTWNLDSQIPDVVMDNSHLKEKTDKLVAFSSKLAQYQVDSKKAPTSPVVVIKENERMVAKSKLENGAKKNYSLVEQKSVKKIAENKTHSFYFIGDADYGNNSKNARLMTNRFTPDVLSFYYQHNGGYSAPGTDRDWVYYRIWPYFNNIELIGPNINGGADYDWSKGDLGGYYYTEKLTKFKFNSATSLQEVSSGWTEGNLEFHVTISFIHRDGGMQTDLKVFHCSANQLKDGNGNPVDFDPDVELMPWDMYRYGDEWKLSVLEHDPSGSTTKTITTKSTYSGNFELNGGIDIKIVKLGTKFGGSATFEKTETQTITISQASQQLGDARFLFDYPIMATRGYYGPFTVNTGSIDLGIEPVIKQNDPRPYPYID